MVIQANTYPNPRSHSYNHHHTPSDHHPCTPTPGRSMVKPQQKASRKMVRLRQILRECEALVRVDVQLAGPRPHVRIRHQIAKGGRGRRVPLWWDAGTLTDLNAWYRERVAQGGRGNAPFVCGVRGKFAGHALTRATIRRRFLTACKVLGLERLSYRTIHHGRHTFISHALAGGRTIAEVRAVAGHASLVTTSGYLHVAVEDGGEVGALFG